MQNYLSLILPLSLIIISVIIGLIFKKIILGKMQALASKTKWYGDDIIYEALQKTVLIWFISAGCYGAFLTLHLPGHFSDFIFKSLLSIFIFSVTVFCSNIAAGFIKHYSKNTEGILPATSIFSNLARAAVYIIGILIILQSLGISIAPVLTALGVGGLAVALALQDTLSNLFSGLQIIVSKQVKVGDYIKIDSGDEGYVVDVTWRNTTIRALANNMIVIPNAKLASAIIINFNEPDKNMSVLVQVGVSYDSDLEKVERVTIEVATELMHTIEGGIKEFEPFIRYNTFGDSSINFTVILRAQEFVNQYLLKHEFIKKLHQRYQQENIEIPFPIRTIIHKNNAASNS